MIRIHEDILISTHEIWASTQSLDCCFQTKPPQMRERVHFYIVFNLLLLIVSNKVVAVCWWMPLLALQTIRYRYHGSLTQWRPSPSPYSLSHALELFIDDAVTLFILEKCPSLQTMPPPLRLKLARIRSTRISSLSLMPSNYGDCLMRVYLH